ncbi:MAG: PIN domain-containing protein [Candidatus Hydrothermarchaeota archaeon]|nr:PIN domain-containing protein [Candidatus Hydrothermarchaeota archaeon]
MELFFDTSAIFAWFGPRDGNHKKASVFMEKFRKGETKFRVLVTTDAIFTEVIDLTQIKLGKTEALRLGNVLRRSTVIKIVSIAGEDRENAWEIMKKFRDQDSNFTDSLSFAVMDRAGIDTAFTFDTHFEIHGYGTVP